MKWKMIALATVTTLIAAAAASALVLEGGDLVLIAKGGFAPTKLPKSKDAPIKIYGGGKASTKSGELPPIVETLEIEFDRHGHVETKGLEVCTSGKLQSTTVPQARRACPNAIVGKGTGSAIVQFPEQNPIPISSPITLFNGPKQGGNDTIIAHAFTTVPIATTFIIPVVIEKISNGVYGYRTKAKIPKIAGGAGHPISGNVTVDRKWTFKGHRYSYVNARCETGHLQANVKVGFKDGTFLSGTFIKRCSVSH
ncbi:MAG TPA: hypothetical protein VHP56_08150 [Solirubrobacterales bacterium]|jgi:hypothetical protein|nr:hypothetical protein [Solirubrobacterales bacterium]